MRARCICRHLEECQIFGLKGKFALGTGAGGEYRSGRGIALRLTGGGADVVATDIEMKPCADADGGPAGHCRRQQGPSGAVLWP